MKQFHVLNRRIAEASGVPLFDSSVVAGAEWGNVEYEDVLAWNQALHSLYLALYFAGYNPVRTRFRISDSHIATLDFVERSLATSADSDASDIEIEFDSIFVSVASRSVPCGIMPDGATDPEMGDLFKGLDEEFYPRLEFGADGGCIKIPVMIAHFDGGNAETFFDYRSPSDRHDFNYLSTISNYVMPVEAPLVREVQARWHASLESAPGNDSWKIGSSSDEGASSPPTSDGEALSDLNNPAGLLWLFDAEKWTFPHPGASSSRLKDNANTIWKAFKKRGFSTPDRTGYSGDSPFEMSFGNLSSAAANFFAMDKQRAKRFYEAVDVLARDIPAFPAGLAGILPQLSYLELLMVLIDQGVIASDLIGGGQSTSPDWDDAALDFDYYAAPNGRPGAGERIEISLYGQPVAQFDYEKTLFDYRASDPDGAAIALRDLVFWEFREKDLTPVDDGPEAQRHHLILLSAPGVKITASRHPLPTVYTQVLRVQDPYRVPSLFTPIDLSEFYISSYAEFMPAGMQPVQQLPEGAAQPEGGDTWQAPTDSSELPAFSIRTLLEAGPEDAPDTPPSGDCVGVEIEFPAGDVILPPLVNIPGAQRYKLSDMFGIKMRIMLTDSRASDQRFGFHIYRHVHTMEQAGKCWANDDGSLGPLHMFSIVVHKTANVRCEVELKNPREGLVPDDYGGHFILGRPDCVRWYCYNVVEKPPSDIGEINLIPYDDGPLTYNRAHEYRVSDGTPKKAGFLDRDRAQGYWIDWFDGILPDFVEGPLDDYLFSNQHTSEDGTPFQIPNIRRVNVGSQWEFRSHQFIELAKCDDYRGKESWTELLGKLFLDIGVGFVPVVGDAVDLAELQYVVVTGRDKWGDPVSGWQFVLMCGCTALPFVGNGWAKGAAAVVE